MSLVTLLLGIVIVLVVLSLPIWSRSRRWQTFPAGGLAVAVLILCLLVLIDGM